MRRREEGACRSSQSLKRRSKNTEKGLFLSYLSRFLRVYLVVSENDSPHTVRAYKQSFIVFFEYMRDAKGVSPDRIWFDDLGAGNILCFLDWLSEVRGSAVSTRNSRLAALKAFCYYLQIEAPEYAELYVSTLSIKTAKPDQATLRYISPEAVSAILSEASAAGKRRHLAILQLLYDSGARISEIANLDVCNASLTPDDLQRESTIFVTGKGKKNRIIPIMPETARLLLDCLKRERRERASDEPFFVNRFGDRYTPDGIRKLFRSYCDRARTHHPELFPPWRVTPHTFRHSMATHYLNDGGSLERLREILGHENISTTLIYAEVTDISKTAAVKKTGSRIFENTKTFSPAPEEGSLSSWFNDNVS